MNQIVRFNNPQELVLAQEQQFNAVLSTEDINFQQEAEFAIQHFSNNQYLAKVALQNPMAATAAIKNVAAIGVSLNPAKKHAYLVPRGGKVCLDIGYIGLMDIATSSGSVEWVQAKIVYSSDEYRNTGINTKPVHNYSAFSKSRGEIVGAYCVAKTASGDFLTHEMNIDRIYAIRNRSESFKKGAMSPWKTDEIPMILKTVVKSAYTYWPKTDRMSAAVDYLNQNEGIDFKSEQQGMKDLNPTSEQLDKIRKGLEFLDRKEDAFLDFFATTVAKRGIPTLADATAKEASQMLSMINQIIDQKNAKQAQQTGDVF